MFAQQLDLGDVYNIPSFVGMARLLASLVVMIVDLNLRMPHSRAKLNLFNDEKNSFVIQLSDDGALETSEQSMSLGTLTLWNFMALD